MKRIAVLVFGLALLATGCAKKGAVVVGPVGGDDASPSGSNSSRPPASPGASNSPSSPAGGQTMTFEVWFEMGERLFVTKRTEPFSPAIGTAAMNALLAGPTDLETSAGVGTVIPAGTRLLGLSISGGVATVDLSSNYESGGGSLSASMRLAQVVYTLTQFRSVDGVRFRLDGRPVEVFSGEGIVLDRPATREDYDELLPQILVQQPVVGETVSSPVTIAGTADVFEATVSYRILDEDGRAIVEGFTNATCGTGCRGDFSKNVAYHVDHDQRGTVFVFESSAENGQPINVVRIPVTLTA